MADDHKKPEEENPSDPIPLAEPNEPAEPPKPRPKPDAPSSSTRGAADTSAGDEIPIADPNELPEQSKRARKPESRTTSRSSSKAEVPLDEPKERPKQRRSSRSSSSSTSRSASSTSASSTASAAPPTAPAPPAAAPTAEAEPEEVDEVHCRTHPDQIGKWWCPSCQRPVCRECVKIDENLEAGRPTAYCQRCLEPCKINRAAKLRPEDDNSPFRARVGRAFAYPLRGSNWAILLLLAIAVTAAALLGYAIALNGTVLLPSVIILPFVALFLVPWLYDILAESARGGRDMPTLNAPTDIWADLLHPLIVFLSAHVVCFAPAVYVEWFMPTESAMLSAVQGWLAPTLWIVGHFLLPMMLIVVTLFETPLAIRPSLVLGGIATMGGDYFILVIVLALAPLVVSLALAAIGPLAIALAVPATLYLLALNMHLMGQAYHANRQSLAWFV